MIQENRFLIFDTETKGLDRKLIYDIGYIITNRRGDAFAARRFLVKEIITDADIMRDAFYNRKIYTDYIPMLNASYTPMLFAWSDILEIMRDDIATHGVTVASAYNFAFDADAMRQTSDHTGAGRLFTTKPKILDLWLFACLYLFNTNLYREIATRENWKSPAGNYKTTAEHAYRFLTGCYEYTEPHTSLEDAAIELEIFSRLMRKRQRIPYNEIRHDPWRIPQEAKA